MRKKGTLKCICTIFGEKVVVQPGGEETPEFKRDDKGGGKV